MDPRDEYTRQEPGYPVGRGEPWAFEEEPRISAPRSPGVPRGPRSGEPMPPPIPPQMHPQGGPDPLFDPLPPPPPPSRPQPPPPPVQDGAFHEPTGAVDASSLQRSIRQTDGLYRSSKPVFAVVYGAIAGLAELMMLRPFFEGLFKIQVLAPLLAMIAFPMLALGLYGLATGAATAVQFQGPRVWLRTPLVYVPIGLLLLVAAGAAVG